MFSLKLLKVFARSLGSFLLFLSANSEASFAVSEVSFIGRVLCFFSSKFLKILAAVLKAFCCFSAILEASRCFCRPLNSHCFCVRSFLFLMAVLEAFHCCFRRLLLMLNQVRIAKRTGEFNETVFNSTDKVCPNYSRSKVWYRNFINDDYCTSHF